MEHNVAVAIALIGLLGIASQWAAWRFRIPAIVALTAAGLLAGPVLGILQPSATFGAIVQPFVGAAVAVILFEGGLRLHRPEAAAVPGIRRLCTVGLLLAFVFGTGAGLWVGGLSVPTALVLGAILVVTGPTVITPLLRQARLQTRTANLFLWEGIINDPLGALLAVVVFEFYIGLGHGQASAGVVAALVLGLAGGAGLGVAAGYLLAQGFRRGEVPEFLKAPMLLAAVVAVYTAANAVHDEAGLLAATVMGAVIGNSDLASMSDLSRFKESITVALVSSVFIVLAADMDVSSLLRLDPRLIGLLLAFLFVVRPAAILLSTLGAGMALSERLLLAWIAPRGIVAAAVAGVFAPRLVEAGFADGDLLVPFVFTLVVVTVVVHGFSLGWMARLLGLSSVSRDGLLIVGASPWTTEFASTLRQLEVPVVLSDSAWSHLRAARLSDVPVHFGEVLSEEAASALPLHTVSTALAATDNDAYNSLVCVHFGPQLDRSKVFQIASRSAEEKEDRNVPRSLRGRLLMAPEADYAKLDARMRDGWTFQRTRLTEQFTYEDWRDSRDDDAWPLAVLKKNGVFTLHSPKLPIKPEDGDILISFGAPQAVQAAEEPADAKSALPVAAGTG